MSVGRHVDMSSVTCQCGPLRTSIMTGFLSRENSELELLGMDVGVWVDIAKAHAPR